MKYVLALLLLLSTIDALFSQTLPAPSVPAAPGSPTEGDCYQSSSDHHFYIYNGSAWKQLDN
jgi:hypothetical protein